MVGTTATLVSGKVHEYCGRISLHSKLPDRPVRIMEFKHNNNLYLLLDFARKLKRNTSRETFKTLLDVNINSSKHILGLEYARNIS